MGTSVAVASVIAKTALDYKDAKDEKKQLKKEKELKEAEIKKKKEIYEQEKTDRLKAKIASKKASLAANGLGTTDASSAVLLGSMEKETDEDIANNEYFSDLNLSANEMNYNYKKNKNLLARRKMGLNAINSASDGLKLL